MSSLPGGTVTFVFTDIEGSTRLLQELGDVDYAQVARDHRRVVRDAFGGRGGTEIDTQGDAFFFSFPRARDAVGAAVDAQRALRDHEWPQGKKVQVRMGLHTGRAAPRRRGLPRHRRRPRRAHLRRPVTAGRSSSRRRRARCSETSCRTASPSTTSASST